MKVTKDTFEAYGKSARVDCPKCGKHNSLTLYRGSNGLGAFGISLVNYKHNYFALCKTCGALFSLDNDALKESTKIGKYKVKEIDPSGLTYLQTLPIRENSSEE